MELPSKEILSAILERQIGEVIECGDNSVNLCSPELSFLGQYNIYELAHKAKEWALRQGYRIASQSIKRGLTFDIGVDGFAVVYTCNREAHKEREDTEIEAIFKAAEWILNQEKGV